MKKLLSSILVSSTLVASCNAEKQEQFTPTWESISQSQPAQWWEDGKFGIFIHWGPYSVAGYKLGGRGYAEAITNDMYKRAEAYEEFMMEKFGDTPPNFGYKDWIPLFTAEKWDPNQWAELFKESGAKYVIPTAEHHDGWANWDSDLTDWCATKMGPKRDLIGDLADAVRAKGMNYGVSYHRERHPNRFENGVQLYGEPFPLIAEEIKLMPEAADLYGPFGYTDEFIEDYVARWKELEDKYQPDFMWIDDIPLFREPADPQIQKFEDAFKVMISDYLNKSKTWGKEVYFNNKGRTLNFPDNCGCMERDNLSFDSIGVRWQNPATLGVSYAYMSQEEDNDSYRTPTELIELLVDVVSKNGNLLLNIGPRADGTIPEGMQKRLLEMGVWLKENGEAIYGTRPWFDRNYGESYGEIIPTGDVPYKKHALVLREREYRFTTKGDTIYVTALQDDKEPFNLSSFKGFEVKSVKNMKGDEIAWDNSSEGLKITPESNAVFNHAKVYVVQLSN